ncbi:carbonic anhydrase-like [Amblyomma americanum]
MLGPLESKRLRRRSLRRLLPWMVRRLLGGVRGSNKATFPLTLDKLMPPAGRAEFFTYRGSLTTPPCTEPVRWIVFSRPAFVSETLVQRLRGLEGRRQGSSLSDNFRPPQRLNGRKITASFPPF